MFSILAHGSRGRQISLSQNKTQQHQQQQQQQLAKAKMDLRKDNTQVADRCMQKGSTSPTHHWETQTRPVRHHFPHKKEQY